MSTKSKRKRKKKARKRNPVAKNANKFNKCVAHEDKTKYKRRKKHVNQDDSNYGK